MCDCSFSYCVLRSSSCACVQEEVIKRAQKKSEVAAACVDDGYGVEDSRLQANLVKLLGPQKKKVEEVDLAEAMEKAGLTNLFNPDQWPDSGAVRELASQMKHKKFVACDLHK